MSRMDPAAAERREEPISRIGYSLRFIEADVAKRPFRVERGHAFCRESFSRFGVPFSGLWRAKLLWVDAFEDAVDGLRDPRTQLESPRSRGSRTAARMVRCQCGTEGSRRPRTDMHEESGDRRSQAYCVLIPFRPFCAE